MKPTLSFKEGYVTIELSPFQCATLAKACYFASEQSLEPDIDNWRTLAALFHACTVVGLTQWQMSESELKELLAQLAELNLSQDDCLISDDHNEPNHRRNGHQH